MFNIFVCFYLWFKVDLGGLLQIINFLVIVYGLVGQARKSNFNSPTPLYVYDNLSITKTWVTHKLMRWE